MPKIQLIALDIDGTLLDDEKRLPEANRAAVRAAHDAGIRIAIASGRMTPRIEPVEELLDLDCTVIAYNGAKVVSPRSEGRQTLVHQPVTADVASFFIDFAAQHGYPLNFYDQDRLYAQSGASRQDLIDLYARRTGATYHYRDDLAAFRGTEPTKLILLADPPDCDQLVADLGAELGDRTCLTKSEPEYLEVTATGVDKGSALKHLASRLGIPIENTLAMGDADNDLTLVEAAGLGVAVANANSNVRAVASKVTDADNNAGAVAEAIERWALGSDA